MRDAFLCDEQGRLAEAITPVTVPRRKQDPLVVDTDEHPRPGKAVEALGRSAE